MWIIQCLSELIGLQMHSTNANFGLWTAKIKYIFRSKQQIFCFSFHSLSTVNWRPFLQQLSRIWASALVVAPSLRATAANIRSIYNFPVSLHQSILLFPGGRRMAEHACQSLWKWLRLTSYMQGTLPWPGGEGRERMSECRWRKRRWALLNQYQHIKL